MALSLLSVLLSIFIIVFGVYAPSINSPYFLDDQIFIPSLEPYMAKGLWQTLVANWQMICMPERVLTAACLWLNYKMTGMSVVGFKICSITLHAIVGFMLYLVIERLNIQHLGKRNHWFALGCALLFLLHPANATTVTLVWQRAITLASIFSLLSFYFYIRYHQDSKLMEWGACFFFFILAMLSKPNAVALVGILALYAVYFKQGVSYKRWISLAPFFAVAILTIYMKFVLNIHEQYTTMTWQEYLAIQVRVVFMYFHLLFLAPQTSHLYYPINDHHQLYMNWTWLAATGHLFILAMAIICRHYNRLFSFALLASYIALIPESSIFVIKHVMWEYRIYIPFIFLTIGIASLFAGSQKYKQFQMGILWAAVLFLAALTWIRLDATNSETKWRMAEIRYNPENHAFNYDAITWLIQNHHIKGGLEIAAWLDGQYPQQKAYALFARFNEIFSGIHSVAKRQDMMEYFQYVPDGAFRMDFIKALDVLASEQYSSSQLDLVRHSLFYPHLSLMQQRQETTYINTYRNVLSRLRAEYSQHPPENNDGLQIYKEVMDANNRLNAQDIL